jgi:hypothetical protein
MTARPEAEPSRPGSDTDLAAAILAEALDRRIAAMRALVAAQGPGSTAEALRILRDAFPQSSLSDRIAAISNGG